MSKTQLRIKFVRDNPWKYKNTSLKPVYELSNRQLKIHVISKSWYEINEDIRIKIRKHGEEWIDMMLGRGVYAKAKDRS